MFKSKIIQSFLLITITYGLSLIACGGCLAVNFMFSLGYFSIIGYLVIRDK